MLKHLITVKNVIKCKYIEHLLCLTLQLVTKLQHVLLTKCTHKNLTLATNKQENITGIGKGATVTQLYCVYIQLYIYTTVFYI